MRRIGSLGVVLCVCGLLLAACDSGLFESTGVNLSNGEVASACNVLAGVNYARMRHLRTFEGYTRAVQAVAFSPDGKTPASGGFFNEGIKLWDVATGKNTATLKGHTNHVYSVAFSPDGKTLASGSADRSIKLWDVAPGKKD